MSSRRQMLKALPTEVFVGASFFVEAFGEDAALDGLAEAGGFALFEFLDFVEALQEEQVGDLFDDFDRVGNAAGPEGIPDAVDLIADIAGEHWSLLLSTKGWGDYGWGGWQKVGYDWRGDSCV